MDVLSVESHSRSEQDWYAVTVAVDVLAFLYVVVFYQVSQPRLPKCLFCLPKLPTVMNLKRIESIE